MSRLVVPSSSAIGHGNRTRLRVSAGSDTRGSSPPVRKPLTVLYFVAAQDRLVRRIRRIEVAQHVAAFRRRARRQGRGLAACEVMFKAVVCCCWPGASSVSRDVQG